MKGNRGYRGFWLQIMLCGLFPGIVYAELNQLCKIFHHELHNTQNVPNSLSIELGKIVFYFSKEPACRLLTDNKVKGKKELTFVFPSTHIKAKECLAALESIKACRNKWYSLNYEVVSKPDSAIKLSIVFDPLAIEMSYDTFESIGLYKGLVFTFYDRKLLERIKTNENPLIRMASTRTKPCVIVDCGHGGSDPGSIGYDGLKEKDVTLNVGLHLASSLREHGIETILTRSSDIFVPLDQRTCCSCCDAQNSIFVSLHANFAENKSAAGIETYCLSPPLLKRNYNTMEDYTRQLLEYIACDKYNKSLDLASVIHGRLITAARTQRCRLIDRHIKHAVTQVLLATVLPSVLIELGFVSNIDESIHLRRSDYQHCLARGICDGIISYFSRLKSL